MDTMRRTLLVAGAGWAATSMISSRPAGAQAAAPAPAAAPEPPAFYRFRVGEAEVTVLSEGFVMRRSDGWVTNAPVADVEAALRAAFVPVDAVRHVFNVTVVRIGGRTVLIDAGFADNGGPTTGRVASGLVAAGIDPARIDTVLVSHMHPDHAGGLRLRAGALAFPNAEIVMPEPEWAWWTDEGNVSRTPERYRMFFGLAQRVIGPDAARVRRVAPNTEVVPGITAIPSYGHTPGHVSYVVASGGRTLLVQGDVAGRPDIFVRHPGWHNTFDMDPAVAEASRRRIYDMAAAERMPIVGYHFPFPAVGYVVKAGNGYDYVPKQWGSGV